MRLREASSAENHGFELVDVTSLDRVGACLLSKVVSVELYKVTNSGNVSGGLRVRGELSMSV